MEESTQNIIETKDFNNKKTKEKDNFKMEKCKVLKYDKISQTLDVDFKGYGLRLKNIKNFNERTTAFIKYKGEIGTPNFVYKMG